MYNRSSSLVHVFAVQLGPRLVITISSRSLRYTKVMQITDSRHDLKFITTHSKDPKCYIKQNQDSFSPFMTPCVRTFPSTTHRTGFWILRVSSWWRYVMCVASSNRAVCRPCLLQWLSTRELCSRIKQNRSATRLRNGSEPADPESPGYMGVCATWPVHVREAPNYPRPKPTVKTGAGSPYE
jgi:hypothetical protein